MNGAALKSGMMQPRQPRGMSGKHLAQFGPMPEEQAEDDQIDGMSAEDMAPVFEAAREAGVEVDPQMALRDPAAMEQVLAAASKADMFATDGGAEHLMRMAQAFGVKSPYHRGKMGAPGDVAESFGPSGRPRPMKRAPHDYSGRNMPDNYSYPYDE